MTIRDDVDPKFDANNHWNQIPEDGKLSYDVCDAAYICDWSVSNYQKGSMNTFECERFSWSGKHMALGVFITSKSKNFCLFIINIMFHIAWGEWSQCDLSCQETGGVRKRFRKCINVCTQKEDENEKCRPFVNLLQNKTFTNKDYTRCTPCPAYGDSIKVLVDPFLKI